MDIVLMLIPVALGLGAAFAGLFVLAARDGQFEDLDDAPLRMLVDEEVRPSAGPRSPVVVRADRLRQP